MKKLLALLAIAALIIAIVVYAIPQSQTSENENAQIAATLFPVYDIAQNITGDTMNVALILPPGTSTHTYEPTPRKLRELQNTEIIFAIGHEADDWTDQIIQSIGAEKVVVDEGIEIRESTEDEEEHDDHEDEDENEEDHEDDHEEKGHHHGETDPHYWLTIPNAKIIAMTIADDLSTRFPEHADVFAANLDAYLTELDAADNQLRAGFDNVGNKNLITLHDAWYYFADEYGLNIVGTFEPTAGREPTPQYLVELTEAIETSGSKTLYSEPQLSTSGLESFARDNDLSIAELDPIGGTSDRESYIDLMLYNAEIIAQNQ